MDEGLHQPSPHRLHPGERVAIVTTGKNADKFATPFTKFFEHRLGEERLLGAEVVADRAEVGTDAVHGTLDRYEFMRSLIVRVGIDNASICVELRRSALIEKLELPIDPVSRDHDTSVQLKMPAELRRLGKEKRLIVAAHMPKSSPDQPLIKVVVRAHNWFEMLKNGKFELISELARAENVQRTYPSRIIPLAFLAPDITEAILEGRQPIDLSVDRLLSAMPLPLAWDAQRAALGFAIC